jgi:hypothetical protein
VGWHRLVMSILQLNPAKLKKPITIDHDALAASGRSDNPRISNPFPALGYVYRPQFLGRHPFATAPRSRPFVWLGRPRTTAIVRHWMNVVVCARRHGCQRSAAKVSEAMRKY